MEDARSEDLLWHCHRVRQSRPGHSCQFRCWSTEPRPIVEQALVEDPFGSPPCSFLLLLFHIYNKGRCFLYKLTSTYSVQVEEPLVQWRISGLMLSIICATFSFRNCCLSQKMCVCTLLSPRALPPPSGQFDICCSGYKQKYSTHLFKTLPHHNKPRGLIFWGV